MPTTRALALAAAAFAVVLPAPVLAQSATPIDIPAQDARLSSPCV